jgi:transposase
MKREGLSTQAISTLTGYDRKTVRKYLLEPEAVPQAAASMTWITPAALTLQGNSSRWRGEF